MQHPQQCYEKAKIYDMQKRRILRKHFKKWTSSNSREANFLKAEYATISPNCPGGPSSARSSKSAFVRKTHQGKQVDGTADLRAQLEARLDSVLWKTGLTKSILEAKQAINHKRVRVNHTRVTLPGIHLYPGDIIQLFQSNARVHPHSAESPSERSSELGSDAFAHDNRRSIQNIEGSESAKTHIAEVDYATNTLIIVSEPYLASVLSAVTPHVP